MKFKVNDKEVEMDGDWMQCPECEIIGFPLLSWMSYCPMCKNELTFEGLIFLESTEGVK